MNNSIINAGQIIVSLEEYNRTRAVVKAVRTFVERDAVNNDRVEQTAEYKALVNVLASLSQSESE